MQDPIGLDSTTFGILIDGYEDTEHAPCTLTIGAFGKVTIEATFPYLEPLNFENSGEHLWVNKRPIPKRMTFLHHGGVIELFGVTFISSSSSFGASRTDRISCDVEFAIEGPVLQPGESPPALVGFRQIFLKAEPVWALPMHHIDFWNADTGKSSTRSISIPDTQEIWRWSSEGIQHVISIVFRAIQEAGRTEITSRLEFESTSANPLEFHLMHTEQQKFVALMQIVNNKQVPLLSPSGLLPNQEKPIYQRLRSGRMRLSLIRESAERDTKPCISTSSLTPELLEAWYSHYPKYFRAISALSSLLPRIEIDAEERVINSFIALETIGHILLEGKRVRTEDYVSECLKLLGIESLEFAQSIAGLSTALANNYNGIKHYRTSTFPEVSKTFMLGLVAQGIARAALLQATLGIKVDWQAMSEFEVAHAIARHENLTIGEDGSF